VEKEAVKEAVKKAAEEVNWTEYFASIKSVCPWSKAYWSKQQIHIVDWTGDILALDHYVARVYKHPTASARQLKKMMNRFNEQRPDEEWLYSHPKFGQHSTPVPVLIQQDYALLQSIRNHINNKNDHNRSDS